jgi:hypothetical protein
VASGVLQTIIAVGAAFLFAVLWFDMMFDTQVGKYPSGALPAEILASLSTYYRRVTVEGAPMMYLPVAVMALVLAAVILELVGATVAPWIGWISLALAAWAVVSVAFMAVPRAQRIGRAKEPPDVLSGLARQVLALHSLAALCWVVVIVLQLFAR